MRSQRGNVKLFLFLSVLISILIPSLIFAGNPRVVTMTVQPSTPTYGDRITVTLIYCGQNYNDHELGLVISTQSTPGDARLTGIGQVFIVSRAGINTHTSVPAASPGGEIGYTAAPVDGTNNFNCMTCGSSSNDGHMVTVTYGYNQPLTVPDADFFPGCNNTKLYMHAVLKDNNLNDGEYNNQTACQVGSTSWTIPTLPTSMSIHKSMTGVLQLQNDLLLVSVDYTYANGAPQIRETIPNLPGGGSTWTLMSVGPQGIYTAPCAPPCAVTPGQGITWTLPDRSNPPSAYKGSVTGTVWFLLRVTGTNPAINTRIDNTANSTITGPNGTFTDSGTASIVAGQPAITITKSQSSSTPMYGENITYYLEYQINGSALVAYQPFDDIPLGTYGPASAAPPGWQYRPSATNGTWYIEDPCGTGDRVIRGDTSSANDYPGLLFSGYPMNSDVLCMGIIQSEVLINPAGGATGTGYEGADSLVVIRDDGLGVGGRAYGLVLSVDDFIGTNPTGNIGFQRCGATPYGTYTGGTCMWPVSVNVPVLGNKWYKVKIQTGPGNACAFSAKVWIKGDPEPAAPTITWTDTQCAADGFDCATSGRTWYTGVAEQGGDTALTQDSYNNFTILKPRVSADTMLYDTCPTGVVYVGQQGPDPLVGSCPLVRWDLGMISDEGGSFTWWGRVNTCSPITNMGAIDGNDPIIPVLSNDVIANPICPVITGITKTASASPVSMGQTFTWTISYCNIGPGPITNYRIWDTVPPGMSYGGCGGSPAVASCASGGGMVSWNINPNPLPIGACGNVWWWGTVVGPFNFNPFILPDDIYASADDAARYIDSYLWQ